MTFRDVYNESYDPGYEMPEVPPLCFELYRRLQSRFGQVLIANPREAMTGQIVHGISGPYYSVTSWGETYRVKCPFCRDHKPRLWIPHAYGQPDPINPNKPGDFYGTCFNEECLKAPGARHELYQMIFGVENRNRLREILQISEGERHSTNLQAVGWPGSVVPMQSLPRNHPAWVYLRDVRLFDINTVLNYKLHYCTQAEPRFEPALHRIMAPFFQHGMMVGWQGRYVGEPPHKGVIKYYTTPHIPKRSILYNHDRAKDHPFVAVFEGITDVWRFGDPGVALLGKSMAYGQRLLLQQSWPGKPIIICLDPEAREEAAGMLHELHRSNCNPVVDVHLAEGWDPADYESGALWNIIRSRASEMGIPLPESR